MGLGRSEICNEEKIKIFVEQKLQFEKDNIQFGLQRKQNSCPTQERLELENTHPIQQIQNRAAGMKLKSSMNQILSPFY